MGDPVDELHDLYRAQTVSDIESLPLTTEVLLVSSLDDEKARALTRLRHLRTLYHDGNCRLTDPGLVTLARIDTLRVLDLEWCQTITDEGLLALRGLVNLEWLDPFVGCRKLYQGANLSGLFDPLSLPAGVGCWVELRGTVARRR
jgi:Leucine Rich Repeat (LRR) protein